MYDTDIIVSDKVSYYQMFKELLSKRDILIDKQALNVLYSSVEHTHEDLSKTVDVLYDNFGSNNNITEKMLSELFVLNKIVYPRQVLIAYLRLDRWRSVKLRTCLESMDNDVVLGAMIKNIKALFDSKVVYFKTGKANELVKSLNTFNINLMYRVLVLERNGMKDVKLLLSMYERGLSCNDII